jgi:HD-GYP domain-containing protein (c-di-GMP phosphodiesterase class II)
VQAQARRIEELFLGGAQSLVQALEAKDAYLRGHSLRVAEYAVGIARELGLADEVVDRVLLGSHLHDIGKIGVREEVLHKAGPLTEDEYGHIMEHPVIGARILGSLFPTGSLEVAIVRSHHERVDGRGLPDGLKGDAIPLAVRLVTLADAFDAMTSVRPYRPSLGVDRALQELRDNRGVQFDPVAVDAFLRAFPEVVALPIPTPEYRPPASRVAVEQLRNA